MALFALNRFILLWSPKLRQKWFIKVNLYFIASALEAFGLLLQITSVLSNTMIEKIAVLNSLSFNIFSSIRLSISYSVSSNPKRDWMTHQFFMATDFLSSCAPLDNSWWWFSERYSMPPVSKKALFLFIQCINHKVGLVVRIDG